MPEHDHMVERLARIDRTLNEAKRTAATMNKSDRLLANRLITQLDALLRELTPAPKPRR